MLAGVSPAFASISLNSPTTSWTAITYVGAARTDFLNDEQTGINESDLVGSAVGVAPVQTAFYYKYDAASDSIAFRVRVDGDSNSVGYTGAIWVGLMLDGNDSVDLFAGILNKGSKSVVGFYNPGDGANVSPNTTTIDTKNAIYSEAISASNYLWTGVTVGPTGNDPVAGGTADISGDGNQDYFATWIMPFSKLQSSAASRGITGITASSQIRFVVGTSEQGNSLNQDINGTSGNTNSTSTFASLGAVSPVVTAAGGVVPEPASLGYVLTAGLMFAVRRRRR